MDYQAKYNTLKRKLKVLLYEQESFQKDLEKSQLKLIRVSRDKTFLLDRLLLYEQVSGDSSNDSDATLSSDNEVEVAPKKRHVVVEAPSPASVKSEKMDSVETAAVKMETQACRENVEKEDMKTQSIETTDEAACVKLETPGDLSTLPVSSVASSCEPSCPADISNRSFDAQ